MKSLFKSKTFWLAVIQAVIGIIVIFTTQYPELQTVGGIAVLKSVLDMVLRIITTEPVK